LAGLLTLCPKFLIVTGRNILWLCDSPAVKSFLAGSPPQNPRLRRWFLFLSKFPLTLVHLLGAKNELTDWLSRTEFDSNFGLKSEVESCTKRNAQFFFKIDFPEFNLSDHDDDQIKTIIAVLYPFNPKVIEGKLWYKTDKGLFCESLRIFLGSKVPQALRWTQKGPAHWITTHNTLFRPKILYPLTKKRLLEIATEMFSKPVSCVSPTHRMTEV